MTIWISVTALLVSIASFGNSVWNSIRSIQTQRAQARTDLLLRLVDLRLEYANFNRRIRRLKEHPPVPLPKQVEDLLHGGSQFLEYERRTESYHQILSDPDHKLTVEEHELHRRNFETLLKQLAADNKRLDELLETDRSAKQTSLEDRFRVIKQRVLYTSITNNMPVELHALREFLIEQNLLDRNEFNEFFEKWLGSIAVGIGLPALNVFTATQIEELKEDLSKIEFQRKPMS